MTETQTQTQINHCYPLQLWLTTIFITPLLIFIGDSAFRGSIATDEVELCPIYILFGLLYSLPTFAIVYFVFELLLLKISSSLWLKIIINIVCIGGIYVTLQTIGGTMVPGLTVAYSVGLVVASLLHKIKKKQLAIQN
jgi:hypothetical protein